MPKIGHTDKKNPWINSSKSKPRVPSLSYQAPPCFGPKSEITTTT